MRFQINIYKPGRKTKAIKGVKDVPMLKQVCVIPFRRDFLLQYARLEPTPLEQAESIDMLRILEHGYRVRLVETYADTHAVDTPADLALVESLMRHDPLVAQYIIEPKGAGAR